jgi:long-subunit fatty acid transport protein
VQCSTPPKRHLHPRDGGLERCFQRGGAYRITPKFSISGAVGEREEEGLTSQMNWNAGATYAFTKHVALDLRYADTDEHDLGKTYHSHVTAAIKASF